MIMSVIKDDEQNAAAKSNIALLSFSQAKPHEARKRSLFALLSCLRFSFFSEFASTQIANGITQIASSITQIEVHFLGRKAATERGTGSDTAGSGG